MNAPLYALISIRLLGGSHSAPLLGMALHCLCLYSVVFKY